MKKVDFKRADEWEIGEEFVENHSDQTFGKIVSIRNCTVRPTMAFFLIAEPSGTFTVYTLLRDARSCPIVSRRIPGDVFLGFAEDISIFLANNKGFSAKKAPAKAIMAMDEAVRNIVEKSPDSSDKDEDAVEETSSTADAPSVLDEKKPDPKKSFNADILDMDWFV